MSLKQEILNEIGDKELSLKDIVLAFPDKKPSSVRGLLNLMVKNGELVRPKKAHYSRVFK
jgi:hypothetical protein